MCNFVGGNLFSEIQQMALLVILEEMSESCWERTKIQFKRLKCFVRNVVVLFLALYRVFQEYGNAVF